MQKTRKLVLFGDSAFAEIAREYFDHDSPYEVVAFTVTADYLGAGTKDGLPVVPFEQVADLYPPDEHDLHVALVYNQLNRAAHAVLRRGEGARLPRSPTTSRRRAFVWRNVTMGDNVFIFEDNTVQPFVTLGSNLVLWSGNHIGHHSTLRDHSFISSHVVISGFCDIGESCFFGVNSTVGNNVTVGADCLVGSGALIVRDVPAGSLAEGADDASGGGEHVGEARPSGAVRPVASRVAVTPYRPEQAADWDAFVERSPNGLMLFRRGYMDYHADRFTDASLWLSEDGRPVAVLPASRERRHAWSRTADSRSAGSCWRPRRGWSTVVDAVAALRDHARGCRLRSLVYKQTPAFLHDPLSSPDTTRCTAPARRWLRVEPNLVVDLAAPPRAAGAAAPARPAAPSAPASRSRPSDDLADVLDQILEPVLQARHGVRPRPLAGGDRAAALTVPGRDHASAPRTSTA